MCAWYVMTALQQGGCYPCGIYPAYAYSERFISLGFKEISTTNYTPVKGDIVVLSQNSKSIFGHIAIYNGYKWISDFEQDRIYPSTTYEKESKMRVFRQSDGWHTANIWFSPIKLVEYIKTLINGFHKIKF